VTRDVGRALTLYRKACSLGEADDCMRLGKFYESGKHVKADPAEVVGLYKRACELERNYGEGCYNLARHLVEGKGIERDMPLAIKLFDGACWSGDLPWSCNDLGLLYLNGKGVAKDLDQAEQFFNEACNLEKWKRPHAGYNEGCKNEKRLKRQRDSEP
jgi:TPR repeat protein